MTQSNTANSKTKRLPESFQPTSRLQGRQTTFKINVKYKSNSIHQHLNHTKGALFGLFERIGGLLKMLAKDSSLTVSVKEWNTLNLKIAYAQIEELKVRREALMTTVESVDIELDVPETFGFTVIASHPIVNSMKKLLVDLDNELCENEKLYFAGYIDDGELDRIKSQAINALTGIADRIAKATKPGVRNGGRYVPSDLAKILREGKKLEFKDLPRKLRGIVEAYQLESEPVEEVTETEEAVKEVIEKVADEVTEKVELEAVAV